MEFSSFTLAKVINRISFSITHNMATKIILQDINVKIYFWIWIFNIYGTQIVTAILFQLEADMWNIILHFNLHIFFSLID